MLVGVLGSTDAIVQGSLFGLVGMFSPHYVSALMTGQGVAGIAVSILRIISKVSFPNDDDGTRASTYIYFGLSAFVILLSILAYIFALERSPVTKHYLSLSKKELLQDKRFMTFPLLPDQQISPDSSHVEMFKFSQIRNMGISVLTIFLVTLSLFPGITSELKSSNDDLNVTGWFSIIMIFVFDFGDLIGRSIPTFPSFIIFEERGVLIGSVARLVFFPLFILSFHPKEISSDYAAYFIMFAFAITNGYFATLAMMFATNKVSVHHKEKTGSIMVFILTIGLTSGVWVGFVLGKFI